MDTRVFNEVVIGKTGGGGSEATNRALGRGLFSYFIILRSEFQVFNRSSFVHFRLSNSFVCII